MFLMTKQYLKGFNTQPPEGGCPMSFFIIIPLRSFNTQPPEGGCQYSIR